MRTVTVDRISLFQDYCDTRIEGDSNLDCCIRILSDSILGTLKSANDADNIDASQLYNLTHVLRELENLKLELRVIKEGGGA